MDDLVQDYAFTVDWFSAHIPVWTSLVEEQQPIGKVLEIGSYEGRSTVWLIENAFKATGKGEIFCVDSWEGGAEHRGTDMSAVHARFTGNIAIAKDRSAAKVDVTLLNGASCDELVALLAHGHGSSFDLIYVDGSHQCSDVLSDLVLAFQLCKVGGVIVCDDYLWPAPVHGEESLLDQPKFAIDSFVNCYARKLTLYNAPLYQLFIRKTSG